MNTKTKDPAIIKAVVVTTPAGNSTPATVPQLRAPKKTERQMRVEYTRDELYEFGIKLAEASDELRMAEEDKKNQTATLKARCDRISATIDEITSKIRSRATYKNVLCEIRYDAPRRGIKQVVRLDTLDVVETAPMSMSEMQGELPGIPAEEPAAEILTPESWDDLDLDPLTVAPSDEDEGYNDDMVEIFVHRIRGFFVTEEEEMRTEADRRAIVRDFLSGGVLNPAATSMCAWLDLKRYIVPGGRTLAKDILSLSSLPKEAPAAGEQAQEQEAAADPSDADSAEETAAEAEEDDAQSTPQPAKWTDEEIRKRVAELFLEGKTPGEIGTVLGISVPAVSNHLKKAGLAQAKRRKATDHGTVSVPSDEGSRDDVGADAKTKL